MKIQLLATMMVIGITVFAVPGTAGVPANLTYQGRLLDDTGAPVADGNYLIQFRIYDVSENGSPLWDSNLRQLPLSDGLFSYNLGDTVGMPHDLFLKQSRLWLGIRVGTGLELRPRIKLTSAGFAYQSLRSDSAFTLGGQRAGYYLDWVNLTGMPAGFADGIDDTASSMDWSSLTNVPLGFSDGVDNLGTGTISGVTAGWGLTGGGVHGPVTLNVVTGTGIKLAADSIYIAKNSLNSLHLGANSVGSSEIAANAVGASEIADNSLTADKMFDEPGIASDLPISTVVTLDQNDTIMVDLAVTTITIPSSGYILVLGNSLQSTWKGLANRGIYQIDETSGGGLLSGNFHVIGHESAPNGARISQSVVLNRVYFKNAGTYTFRLEATAWQSNSATAETRCFLSKIVATYFPTAYGTVSASSQQPGDHPDAQAVSVTAEDGLLTTTYKMDLRYYELKAKEARLKATEAELELARAKATANDK